MKNILNRIAFTLLISLPAFAFAASPFLKPVKDLLGDLEIFINFLNWALPALAVIVFFILIVIFILQKTTMFGDRFKVDGGGKGIFYAMVGLAVLFSVYGLIQLMGALVGIDTNRAKSITAPSLPQVGGVSGGGYYR